MPGGGRGGPGADGLENDWESKLHLADKAECWIPLRESSRNYHGAVQEQVCLETGLKTKQKNGLLAARGPFSSFSPLRVLWDPGNWSVPELSFPSLSLHLGLPADSCWDGTHSPHVFSASSRLPGYKVSTGWQKTTEINPCLSKVHMQTQHKYKNKN